MLEKLKEEVFKANLRLKESNLVVLTWGNVSCIDRESNLVVIKPSGVDYSLMKVEDMVVVDLDGNVVEGKLNPSSDTKTHLYLYKHFKDIKSVVHTHSTFATSFAQAEREITPYGTTHADLFYGPIPLTEQLSKDEVNGDYELNTGVKIVERFKNLDYNAIPGVLVNKHGVFCWGKDGIKSVDNAITIEEIAKMAFYSELINKDITPINQYLLDKHYSRKHGKNAYYGQNNKQ